MRLETLRIGGMARIALLAATLGMSAMGLAACGSDESPADQGNGGDDAGVEAACPGVVDEAGNCVAKCDDTMCNAGNFCVDNSCKLQCAAHIDCPAGYQCTGSGKKDSDGSDITFCAPSDFPMGEGGYLWPCPNGDECGTDGVCIGAGPGDIDAYCTKYDCQDDSGCPSGMWCGVLRDFHQVCNNPDYPAAGIEPDPGDCIDPASFTADGKTYRLGPVSLLRNACLRRNYCAECDTDMDCSLNAGYVCVKTDASQKGYCSRSCTEAKQSCPWEGASTCSVVDSAKGDTCNPTYGACAGNKDVCSPCRNDDDCWDSSSSTRRMCLRSMFSLEPYCVDIDTKCQADADCPKSGAGVQMQCMTDPAYAGSLLDHVCYPADNGLLQPGHPSCYPAP